MLEMQGEERFEQDADRVYAVVTDLAIMAQNIPDLVSHEVVSPEQLKCVVRPGFSFLRMTMKTRIDLVRDAAVRGAQLKIFSQGMGASIDVESQLHVTPAETTGRRKS
jgi:carbon monoxide dehydrogenase subunit G